MYLPKFKFDKGNEESIKYICQTSPKVMVDSKKFSRQETFSFIRYLKAESQSNKNLKGKLQQLLKQGPSTIFKMLQIKNQTLGTSSNVSYLIEDLDHFRAHLKTIEIFLRQHLEISKFVNLLKDLKQSKLAQFQNDLAKNKILSWDSKNLLKQISDKSTKKQSITNIASQGDVVTQIQQIISKFMEYGPDTKIIEINQLKSNKLKEKMISWQRILAYQFVNINRQLKNDVNNFIRAMSKNTPSTEITNLFNSLSQKQQQYFGDLYYEVLRLKDNVNKITTNRISKYDADQLRKAQQQSTKELVRERNEAKLEVQKIQNQMINLKNILQKMSSYSRLPNNEKNITINEDNCPEIYINLLLEILNQLKEKGLSPSRANTKNNGTYQYYSKEVIESLRTQNISLKEYVENLEKQKKQFQAIIQKLQDCNLSLKQQNIQINKSNQNIKKQSINSIKDEKNNKYALQNQKLFRKMQDLTTQNEELTKIISLYEETKKAVIKPQENRLNQQKLKLQNQNLINKIQELRNKNNKLMESHLRNEAIQKEQVQQKGISVAELNEQIKRLKKIIFENSGKLKQRDQQQRQLSKQYNLLGKQNIELKQNINTSLSNNKQKLNLQISMIKENEKNIISQLKKLQAMNQQLNSIITQLRKQKQDLIKAYQIKISQTISEYQKNIEQIQNNYHQANQNLQEARNANQQQQQAINQMRKNNFQTNSQSSTKSSKDLNWEREKARLELKLQQTSSNFERQLQEQRQFANKKEEKIVLLNIELTKTKQQLQLIHNKREEVDIYKRQN